MLRRVAEPCMLAGLIAIHLLLGVYYDVTIPIWEAHDEPGHYAFALHLAQTHRLPIPGQQLTPYLDEAHQPPLYYILAAVPIALLGTDEAPTPKPNPHMSRPDGQGGQNWAIHDAAAESWPFRGTAQAVHGARCVSVLLGALAILFTFWTARLLFPEQPAIRWGAVLILAFWPQYRFTTAVINNDIMVTVSAALVTWLLTRAILIEPPQARNILGAGAASGLALLSKGNGLALPPVVLIVSAGLALRAQRTSRWKPLVWLVGATGLGLGIAGWWYARNLRGGAGLFGGDRSVRWVTQQIVAALLGGRNRLSLVLPALQHGFLTFFAGFGWNTASLPKEFHLLAGVWSAAGFVGVVLWLLRRPNPKTATACATLLLIVLVVLTVPLFFVVSQDLTLTQGRTWLPALPTLSVLLSLGWNTLLPRRLRIAGWTLLGGAMLVLAFLTPSRFISPVYALPPRLTPEQAARYTPVQATFGSFAELVGYHLDNRFVDPQGQVHLTLVFRVLAQTDVDHTLAVQAFAEQHTLIGETMRYPGRGAFATTSWEPGYLFAEEVAFPVDSTRTDPCTAMIEVSFFDLKSQSPTPVHGPGGYPLGYTLPLTRIKVRASLPRPSANLAAGLQFGSLIRLLAARANVQASGPQPKIELDLDWVAVRQPGKDYTVSLQFRNVKQVIVAQIDRPPRHGEFPTSLWEPGDTVKDHYELPVPGDLPLGTYTLYAIVYDLPTQQRLPAADPSGLPLPNSEAPLLTLTKGSGDRLEIDTAYSFVQLPAPSADTVGGSSLREAPVQPQGGDQ